MAMGNTVHYLHAIERDGLDLKDRAIYLVENAGEAAKLASYMERFPDDEDLHREDLRLALGDVLIQACMMCLDVGFSPREIFNLGIQHVKERYQDFARRGWQ